MNTFKKCFVTAFFAGYIPVAPGTFGTLVSAGLCCALLPLPAAFSYAAVPALFLVLLYPAIRFSTEAETHFSVKDPQQVVIDEVLGYLLTVMFHHLTFPLLAAAFLLFRFFDILKPPPVRWADRRDGPVWVMLDDVLAGALAAALLAIARSVL